MTDYIHYSLRDTTHRAGRQLRARSRGNVYAYLSGVVSGAFLVLAFYHSTGGI